MASTDAGSPTSPPNSLRFRSESHDPSSPSKKYLSLYFNIYMYSCTSVYDNHLLYTVCHRFVIIPANYRVDVPPRKPKSLYGPPRKPVKKLFGSASEERKKSPAPGMSVCLFCLLVQMIIKYVCLFSFPQILYPQVQYHHGRSTCNIIV